jgi:hypothetical protein
MLSEEKYFSDVKQLYIWVVVYWSTHNQFGESLLRYEVLLFIGVHITNWVFRCDYTSFTNQKELDTLRIWTSLDLITLLYATQKKEVELVRIYILAVAVMSFSSTDQHCE